MKILFFLALVSVAILVHAQENSEARVTSAFAYKIGSVSYEIEGSTWVRALDRFLDWNYGRLWSSEEEFDRYILEKSRVLSNNRIFQRSLIEYTFEIDDDGIAQARVRVWVQDSWNILAVPIPKYNDNEGLVLSLRVRDNNFFGTMEQLRLNLEFKRSTQKENSLGGFLETGLPLDVGGEDWFLRLEGQGYYKTGGLVDIGLGVGFLYPFSIEFQTFQYELFQRFTIKDSKDAEFDFRTALSTSWSLDRIRWNITPSQSIKIFTSYADPDGYYATSRLDFGASIPLNSETAVWPLTYRPGLFVYTQYLFDKPISLDRSGIYVGAIQNLSFGRWDWVENFRRGFVLGVEYLYQYNLGQTLLDHRVDVSTILYQDFFTLFAVNLRLLGRYQSSAQDNANMEPIRGVLNTAIQGNLGFYANLDWTWKVIRIDDFQNWSGWSWMRFFNFELQLNLFTDVGYIFPIGSLAWDRDRFVWTGGIEVIGFPLAARSYFLRASYGVNLQRLVEVEYDFLRGDVREIDIGLGFHY